MTLDKLLGGIERQLAGQSDLLDLASAWIEKTRGAVVDEIKIDETEYVTLLQKIPLWDTVKDNLLGYRQLINAPLIQRGIEGAMEARLLKWFPTLLHVFNDFLEDPLYSEGTAGHGSLGSPLPFQTVIWTYRSEDRTLKTRKGDCKRLYDSLRSGLLDEDFIIEGIGLQQRWQEYQETTGLPQSLRTIVGRALDHFLTSRIYSDGRGGLQGSVGSPIPFDSVLYGYRVHEGDLVSRRGDCSKVYHAIKEGTLTKKQILESVGMTKRWKEYEDSRALPTEMKQLLNDTLDHFLNAPSYSIGCGPIGNLGNPLSMRSVLYNYRAETGELHEGKGDCINIYNALVRGSIEESLVLDSLEGRERWEAYQQTRRLPSEVAELVRKTFSSFLQHPHYSKGSSAHGPRGSPLSFNSILRGYVTDERTLRTGKGDCRNVYQKFQRANLGENFVLADVGLLTEWNGYQQSTGDNSFEFDSVRDE